MAPGDRGRRNPPSGGAPQRAAQGDKSVSRAGVFSGLGAKTRAGEARRAKGSGPAPFSGAIVCFQPPAGDSSAAQTRSGSCAKQPPHSLASSSPVNDVVKSCQVSSSHVKVCQGLLDGACCNFNALPGKSLTRALRPEAKRPATLAPVAGYERRIARLSAPAKTLSVWRGQDPHFFNSSKSLAGSAVDLLEASFFPKL